MVQMASKIWLGVLLAVLLVVACSSGSGGASGLQAAGQSRTVVAKAFWQAYNSLGGEVAKSSGVGTFKQCPGSGPSSIQYSVQAELGAHSAGQTTGGLATLLQGELGRAGWSLKPGSGQLPASAQKNGIDAKLEPSPLGGPQILMVVTGSCVNVGPAGSGIVQGYAATPGDRYQQSQATSSPVPTGFPTP
jgi:hypothetical protein